MHDYTNGYVFLLAVQFLTAICQGQYSRGNYVVVDSADTQEEIIRKAAHVTPSERQYEWQQLELTGFVHFGINTFEDVEWGQHSTDITKFNPENINVKQWVKVFKDAGFKLIILTCKHHDGFCLWPSKYTDYTIAHTPFQNGKGDIVRDLSKACSDAGIRFGVYLSPWDMHEESYGTAEYNKYFLNQLTELLTNYGEISEVWFDGANGEGPNGKKQIYDWQAYYQLIRQLQSKAVIAVSGPDIRWVGTESGYGRATEWSVLPGSSTNQDAIAARSQQQMLDGAFIPHDLMDEDLGSRDKLQYASSLVWYPAEIDVSIRPRWFYSQGDDELVKTPEKLVDIYYHSVGMNGVLLLNIPPDKKGLIHETDVKNLQGMRYILDETLKENLAQNSMIGASCEKKGNDVRFILDGDVKTYWAAEEGNTSATIELLLHTPQTVNCAMLQENILVGQRIEKFHLDWWNEHQWEKLVEGTTVGYKRLMRFPEVTTGKIRIVIDSSRMNPTLASFGVYAAPPEIQFESTADTFADSINITLTSNSPGGEILYTLDGSIPHENSKKYTDQFWLHKTTTVTCVAISKSEKKSLPQSLSVHKAKYTIIHNHPFSDKYPGGGALALVNGVTGSDNFNDGRWQGYDGSDFDVVIDLGKAKKINKISSGFLRDINSFIFLPESVEFYVSDNNKDYRLLKEMKNEIQQNNKPALRKAFEITQKNITGRYIRVKAKNIGVCPSWHKGAGEKAWLFCDEIIVD
ncbi:MAG: alpha-L-fucosidase [Bacteroidota bacterium]